MNVKQNILEIGDGTTIDPKRIVFNTGAANPPNLEFDNTQNKFKFSENGVDKFEAALLVSTLSNSVFVSKNGNDSLAKIGRSDYAFQTFQAAVDAAIQAGPANYLITGAPGLYDELIDLKTANRIAGFEFNFHLHAGCEIIYTGAENKSVIGKYETTSQNETIDINIHGFGVIEYAGTGVGAAIGNRETNLPGTATTTISIHGANTIKSNSSNAIGFNFIPIIENVALIESTTTAAITCQQGDLLIKNCKTIRGANRAIILNSLTNFSIENSTVIALQGFGILSNRVTDSYIVKGCVIESQNVAIRASRHYNLTIENNRIKTTTNEAITIGSAINESNTTQSHISSNLIYCVAAPTRAIEIGTGVNVAGTINTNICNISLAQTGNQLGRFNAYGGTNDNKTNSNIQF